jgi:CP family cyanate transporter-like MFS transporter
VPATRLVASRTAWVVTAFFAFQSFQAYIAFGWFAKLLHGHGISTSTAGWMVALLSGMSIPISMVVPTVPPARHRAVLVALSSCYLVAYLGLAAAPAGGAWVWMALGGIGGGTFPLALTIIGLRTRGAATTAALSAFSQVIGYVVAGLGPVLFGVLYGATHRWGPPLSLLFVAMALSFTGGWLACRPVFVEDELAASAP